jgi:hypothetical protein
VTDTAISRKHPLSGVVGRVMKTAAGMVRWKYVAGPLRYGAEYLMPAPAGFGCCVSRLWQPMHRFDGAQGDIDVSDALSPSA